MSYLLEAKDVSVKFDNSGFVLHPISLNVKKGETLAIIGESGSGKSTLLKALSCQSDVDAHTTGQVIYHRKDLFSAKEEEIRKMRFTEFSTVFQNSKEYLNPRQNLRATIYEILLKKYTHSELYEKAEKMMELVGLDPSVLELRPRELSGGMIQKFQIACAFCLEPELIYLDEPTSSLDAVSKKEFIELIKMIRHQYSTTFIVVTHDMSLARDLADRTVVMYKGIVCEQATTAQLLRMPRHPYSRALLNCAVEINLYKDAWGIRESTHTKSSTGCPFSDRCTQCRQICLEKVPTLFDIDDDRQISCIRGGITNVLHCSNITKSYGSKPVLKGCDLELYHGEIVSIVGRSGSGKTTLCNIISGFLGPDGGLISFHGEEADYKKIYRQMGGLQFLMQDGSDSLDQHMSVYEVINEPLYLFYNHNDHKEMIGNVLNNVGLDNSDDFLNMKISNLSGGQRQRVALARCLVTNPHLLVADEPTSMLDSSSKANLNRLLKLRQNIDGFSMLVVTHDLASALKISDRIYLLQDGVLTEMDRALAPDKMESLMCDTAAKD